LGTGVALALHAAGRLVIVVDRPLPTALRLHVSLSNAAVQGRWRVGDVVAVHATDDAAVARALAAGEVPVWTGDWRVIASRQPIAALVDARLRGLTDADLDCSLAPLVVALGPGWIAGRHCHMVVETCRGDRLGALITEGSASAHTGIPGVVQGLTHERLLRAPRAGVIRRRCQPGDLVVAGQVVATVGDGPVVSHISGLLRGLKLDGVTVGAGHKVGDVDPRADRNLLFQPTDKSTRIGRAVRDALGGPNLAITRTGSMACT